MARRTSKSLDLGWEPGRDFSPTKQLEKCPASGEMDEEFLHGVPNVGLYLSLRSYFIQGDLMESEIYGLMEQVRIEYPKLLGEVTSLRVDRGVGSERTAETPTLCSSKVDGLRWELEESKKKAKSLDKALRERDYALV
ncbi:uncharacterized protein A4U43_C02F10960 [Asparagus officinalis]|uniref:Uncharacterized protein n=1 Tax=Asparagus officinalis TaxID=4686 RepID=A0A5P1FJC8_ASPOF|nr:uncharacterized protein A4U43_C02F10960 [Asparagus officinalis]